MRNRANIQAAILRDFQTRWHHEYLISLRDHHRTSRNNTQSVKKGDVVVVHDDTPLSVSDKRRYLEKIEEIDDPYSYESRILQADFLSPVRSTNIYNYLVLSTSFCTGEWFKAYKSMDSYNYFASGFVSKVRGRLVGDYFVVVGYITKSVYYYY